MKNKKGFTLVELIGTFAILAVILTIVAIAWININKSLTKAYYDTLEESVLIAGGEYFANNKGALPKLLGEEQRIDIGHLVRNKYSQDDIKARNGTLCDYENSYVAAYKDSYDRTNYYTCLRCGDYGTDSLACEGNVDYSLNVSAKIKGTTKNYKLTGENWANDDVIITFATLNDIEKAYLTNSSGNALKSCNMTEDSNGIRSCEITVTNSGNYQVYGEGNGKETSRQDASVKIDKTKPTYNVPTNQIIVVENINEGLINALISDIKDPESGIKSIEYSLEKEGSSAKYNNVPIKDSFTVNETKELGKYTLTVRVTNNASLSETKTVSYHIKRKVDIPTNAYCDTSLVYNDTEQTLTKKEGLGYTFTNNKGIDAKNYTVVAKLKDNYTWSLENDTSDKTFVCAIKQKDIYITAKNQEITYGDSIAQGIGQVRVTSGLNISGHELSAVTLKTDNVNVTNNGVIEIVSGSVKIKRNNDNKDVTSNYKFNYTNGVLVIKPRDVSELTLTLNPTSYTYDATAKTPTTTVEHGTKIIVKGTDYDVSYTNNVNAGTATATITGKGNYTGEKSANFTINKRSLKITAKEQTINYGQTIQTGVDQVTIENLASGHSVTSIKLTPSTANATTSGTITPSAAVVNNDSNITKNYAIEYVNGKLVINKIDATCPTTSDYSGVYDGNAHGITSTGGSGGTIKYSTDNATWSTTIPTITNVGEISTYVAVVGDNNHNDKTCTTRKVTITKASSTNPTLTAYSGDYDGASHTITVSGGLGGTIKYSTDGSTWSTTIPTRTDAGKTTVYVKIFGDDNHNDTTAISSTITINRAKTATTGSCKTLTYNGNNQTLASGGSNVSYANNTGKDAGSYKVTVNAGSNYAFSNGDTTQYLDCSIGKANGYVNLSATSGTTTYGTTSKTFTVSSSHGGTLSVSDNNGTASSSISGSTVTIGSLGSINAGTTVTVTVKSAATTNYEEATATYTLTINREKTATTGSCYTLKYTGSAQTLAGGGNYVTYSDNTGTDAGTYTVKVTADANHLFSDGTETQTLACTITDPKPPTITFSISGETYGTGYKSGAEVTVTCESEDGIAEFSAKDNTGDTGSLKTDTTNTKSRKITLKSAGDNRKVEGYCKSNNGLDISDSRTYDIYVYSAVSSCGVSSTTYSGYCICQSGTTDWTCAMAYSYYGGSSHENACTNACVQGANAGYSSHTCSTTTTYRNCWHT